MQFRLRFTLPSPLTLPLGYHSVLQGFLYSLLADNPEYATFLHDTGYKSGSKRFKLFVFSLLQGSYNVHKPQITFSDDAVLEVRSPEKDFCDILYHSLMRREHFELRGQAIELSDCTISRKKILSNCLHIDMLSPVCLSVPEGPHRTRYLNPAESEFNDHLQNNLTQKLASFSGCSPLGSISLTPDFLRDGKMQERDKYITRFGGRILIEAWRGRYTLKGNPEDLQFLYDAGLGSRNSQGFGMFQIL